MSKFREARKRAKGSLKERTEASYNSKDDSGKFRSYINSSIPLPKWVCSEGDHSLDIVPFITGKNNPNGLEEGYIAYNVEVYVHFGIGINENAYVCPNLTLGKPCPICEYRARIADDNEKLAKDMAAKRRVVYQVLVYDSDKTERAGLMYWEASWHLAEKNIVAIARSSRTGEFVDFAHEEHGKLIEFAREGKGKTSTDYTGFRFSDRDYDIEDEYLEQTVALGDYIDILSYEQLEAELGLQSGPAVASQEEEPEEHKPRRGGRRSRHQEEPEERHVEEERSEPEEEDAPRDEPKRRSRRSRRTEDSAPQEKEKEETGERSTRLRRRRSRR